ncbi:centromere identifier [Carabus blaptoides fortunei]
MVRRKSRPRNSGPSAKSSNSSTVAPVSPKPKRKQPKTTVAYSNGQSIVMTKELFRTMKRLQLRTDTLIPKLAFSRLVREIIMELFPNQDVFRIQRDALKAMQESCELYLTQYFEDSYLCTMHANRKTLIIKDMQLARRLRGRQDIINH